ncbi:TonB-dependent receptor plug domain-containing protein [Marinicellulosiphila megalodicopiae]|uniref:TonB-dependent receptor plug domain-containing protein n=1 Tax=Marinicellulosiphila megalodicopiae TaxID=2724896 RepID=UPI003BB1FDFE
MKFKKSVLAMAIISTQLLVAQSVLAEEEFSIDDYFSDYDDLYEEEQTGELDKPSDQRNEEVIAEEIEDAEIVEPQNLEQNLEQNQDIQYSQATDDEIENAEELDVTGYFIPDEKKETSQIANVLSFDDMAKTGDSSAGDALKRVSGLSLVGGKFIYVRGLDDRYSSALLNGAVLPSPEPNKKVAPMDIFPTNVLESVLVQKTYSPEFPGEFAGGIIQMRSKALPDLPFTKISFGGGFLTGSTFANGSYNPGGNYDWLGFDDGTRGMSDTLLTAIEQSGTRIISTGPDAVDNIEEVGESFYRKYTPSQNTNLPPVSFNIAYGNRWDMGQNSYGLVGSSSYSYSAKNREEKRFKFSGDGEQTGFYDYNYTTEEVSLNAMLTGGVEIGFDHAIKFTSLFIQDAQDTASMKVGNWSQDTDPEDTREDYFVEYISRQLISNQVDGKHQFDLFDAFWKLNYSQANREAPNTVAYGYVVDENGDSSLYTNTDDIKHAWFDMKDSVLDISSDVEHHIYKGQLEGSVKAGVGLLYKSRYSDARRFRFEQQVPGSINITNVTPEEILIDENIHGSNSTGYLLNETTTPTDNYTGDKFVFSGYTQLDYPFDETMRGTAGVRVESVNQSVITRDIFNSNADIKGTFEQIDILPVMTGTYIFSDAQQMRFAYSRTVARPDFREMSSARYYDVETGNPVAGNPDLLPTTIDSIDTRFEWYGKNDREFTFGAFFKSFENHIEKSVRAGSEGLVTYMNLSRANNFGFEIEVKNDLGLAKSRLSDFYVSSNLTYINSTLSLTDEEKGVMTNNKRPMQGQSDWLANIQMGYDNINTGTQGTLVYNYTGKRVDEAGRDGYEDVYEDGRGTLDFIYKQNIPGQVGLAVSFKAKNMLNGAHTYSQGGNVVREYQEGAKFTISISKTWEALPIDIWSDD